MINRNLCCFLIFCGITFNAAAQDKMETDRPGETETPNIVSKKYFQAETGFNKQNIDKNNYILTHPASLLRYGLGKVELRVESMLTSEHVHHPAYDSKLSFESIEIGTKIALFEEKGIRPQTSFLAHFGLPLHDQDIAPSFRLLLQNSITKKLNVGYNVGVEWDGESSDPVFLYSFAPGLDLNDKWYVYAEVYGFMQERDYQDHNFDAGVAYNISNNTRIDLSAGVGLSDDANRNFIELGFSFRLPTGKRTGH